MNTYELPIKTIGTHLSQARELFQGTTWAISMTDPKAKILAIGGTLEFPDYDAGGPSRARSPFLLIRDEDTGAYREVPIQSVPGVAMLTEQNLAMEMLHCLISDDWNSLISLPIYDITYNENEDVSSDQETYGFERHSNAEVKFLTDGQALAAWQTDRQIDNKVWDFENPDEDGDAEDYGDISEDYVSEQDHLDLSDNIRLYVNDASQDDTPLLLSYLDAVNALVPEKSGTFAFKLPKP